MPRLVWLSDTAFQFITRIVQKTFLAAQRVLKMLRKFKPLRFRAVHSVVGLSRRGFIRTASLANSYFQQIQSSGFGIPLKSHSSEKVDFFGSSYSFDCEKGSVLGGEPPLQSQPCNQPFIDLRLEQLSGLCPRDPRALREAMKDERFAQAQRRRAQTEGRIAIFKNEFLGRPMRAEGFANRALQVSWGVLTHDLWVIAEKLREQRKIREKKLRPAA
jgi:hypothetical protein